MGQSAGSTETESPEQRGSLNFAAAPQPAAPSVPFWVVNQINQQVAAAGCPIQLRNGIGRCYWCCLNGPMLVCTGCRGVGYCSLSCQKLDWKHMHRESCEKIRKKFEEQAAAAEKQAQEKTAQKSKKKRK